MGDRPPTQFFVIGIDRIASAGRSKRALLRPNRPLRHVAKELKDASRELKDASSRFVGTCLKDKVWSFDK